VGSGWAEGLVKSIDTNVLARFIVRDHAAQAQAATQILRGDVLLTPTVLLETVWLLASRYGMPRSLVSARLADIVQLSNVVVRDEQLVIWALERLREGADFTDMIHLVESRDAGVFATFDRQLAKRAGADTPIEIETLEG
jgi:predicted nucleic-acid-binding protein